MGFKCCVPKCRTGYKSQPKEAGVTIHKFREVWKNKIHRDGVWSVTNDTYICSKHFVDSDFIYHSQDTNKRRQRNRNKQKLKLRYIKDGSYPTQFPNCPSYLSKKKPVGRSPMGFSSTRNEITTKRIEEKRKLEIKERTITSICDISTKLQDVKFRQSIAHLLYKIEDTQVTFYDIESDVLSSMPVVKFSLVIFSDLTFKIWHKGKVISYDKLSNIIKGKKITLIDDIVNIMAYLSGLNNPHPLDITSEVNVCVQILQSLEEYVDGSTRPKLQFIVEQLQLAFMNINHRRYSADLLSTCVLWENTSTNLYKQIRDSGLLTIPALRYIKKLTSAISVETGLTEQTIKYLEARFRKLTEREKIGCLMFDEIYTDKRCEIARSNGQIFGMLDGDVTKTLLTVMFKSITSKYEDVIAMTPLTKIDSTILYKLFIDFMNSLTSIGYDIVVSLELCFRDKFKRS